MGGSIRPTSQMKSLRYLVQGAHQAVAKLGLKPSGLVGALQPIGVSWCPKLAVQVRGSAPCPRQSVPSGALAFHPERMVRSPRLILQDAAEPDAWGCGGGGVVRSPSANGPAASVYGLRPVWCLSSWPAASKISYMSQCIAALICCCAVWARRRAASLR